MLKYLVTRGLASKHRVRRDRDNRRPACRLTVEALEGRLLLSGDMVLRWNEALWTAARIGGLPGPGPNTRDGTHTPYLADIPGAAGASEEAAVAQAAHDALVGLFPGQAAVLDLELKVSLETIKDSDAKTAGIMVGQAAAKNMLAARANDGSDKVVDYTPGTNPGEWQPTPPAYLPALTPQWPMVTPFCLQSASQFRSPPPPALTSPEYAAAFNQIKQLGSFDSTTRTADQTEAAVWWAGVPGIPFSFIGMVNKIAENVAVARGNSLVENARLFALLNLDLADETIANFESKQTYNLWRPVTAIRAADTDGNSDTEADPNWMALEPTPNGPSYPSQHSGVAGSFATVLANYFGTDDIPFSVSWEGLPGVTRSFASFSAAAEECAMSRVWLGIHYSFDITEGLALGRSVGAYVYQNFLLPRGGAAAPPAAGPTLFATRGITAQDATRISLGGGAAHTLVAPGPFTETALVSGGSSLPTAVAGVGLAITQATVYPISADATSNSVVYGAHAPRAGGGRVDDVLSADPWEAHFASAP